jgi:L-ascorbate metabolism protein UlaG (beta-lactamase superfamily)
MHWARHESLRSGIRIRSQDISTYTNPINQNGVCPTRNTQSQKVANMKQLTIDTAHKIPPTRSATSSQPRPSATSSKTHPTTTSSQSTSPASLLFIGTATTLLHYHSLTLLTDPNFLHAGDHVHLGPGVTGTRKTNPFIDLEALPDIDVVLLSHYHADHFDAKVEDSLRRDLPIISTPHAKQCLGPETKGEDEAFTNVTALDAWENAGFDVAPSDQENAGKVPEGWRPHVQLTGMPGSHVPPGPLNVAATLNDFLGAVPPTNGWMLELGYVPDGGVKEQEGFECGYRIYISGDTLLVDDLKKIPEMYTHAGKDIDLMLIHLGGTTIPGPSLPLLMVTMDAEQGVKLVKLVKPKVTVPIHYEYVVYSLRYPM